MLGDMIATRDSYGNALVELGKEHDNLVVLDADLAEATKTIKFRNAFPDRHIDCGIAEANMMAFENYRHAEALTLCYRMIPTYTGLPYAKKEVERIMAEEVPFEIGFTEEGWFSVRFPRMLPKKEKGGVEYIRGQLYPALQRFFQNEYPVRFDDCVIIYRHVYAEGFPERKKRDHDNIETNEITDAIALFVMTDDAPKCCQHHHCSAAGPAERTEVYVVPEKDFIKWYEAAKTFPEEGVKLHGQRSIFDEKTVPKPG